MTLARWGAGGAPWLRVAEVEQEQVVLGAFQRAASALSAAETARRGLAITRRTSGGPAVLAGPGTVHVGLWLPASDALTACTPSQLVNRHVRPLLGALSHLGPPAHFFGRDWISVAKRPAAWIGFAHRGETGACLVEAFVAVSHAFAVPPELDGYPARAADPFRGKTPATIAEIRGEPPAVPAAVDAIRRAYGRIEERAIAERDVLAADLDDSPPWDALLEEAIGFVGAAGRPGGGLQLGGDLMISEDALPAIERALETSPNPGSDVVVRALAGGGFVMDGARDPGALARVCGLVRTGRSGG